jgi:hypothetical protein
MPFPFSITYLSTLNENFGQERYPAVLKFVGDFIINKPAKDIIIENNTLKFKPGFTFWSGNIMGPIERGIFILNPAGDRVILTYQFFMYHMFIITGIMAVVLAIVSQQIWFGVGAFLWLCGMNWVTALVRHRGMLDEIAAGIDAFLQEEFPGKLSQG